MRRAKNFHPEWDHVPVANRFLIAMAIGAIAGGGVVLSLAHRAGAYSVQKLIPGLTALCSGFEIKKGDPVFVAFKLKKAEVPRSLGSHPRNDASKRTKDHPCPSPTTLCAEAPSLHKIGAPCLES